MISYKVARFIHWMTAEFFFFFEGHFNKRASFFGRVIKIKISAIINELFFLLSLKKLSIFMPEVSLMLAFFVHFVLWAHDPVLLFFKKLFHILFKEPCLKKAFFVFLLFQSVIYQFAFTVLMKILFSSAEYDYPDSVSYGFLKILVTLFLWGICYCNFVLNEEMPGLMSWIVIIVLAGATYFFVLQEWIVVMGRVIAA